jgi:biopolymer transport protein TolR
MTMSLGGSGRPRADINMTPMIDVLLVLIIIFMVITPIQQRGLHTLIPQSTPPNQPHAGEDENLIVSVLNDGTVSINGETVAWDRLQGRLAGILRTSGNRPVFVRGESGIDFEPVAMAVDLARGAGAERIGLIAW